MLNLVLKILIKHSNKQDVLSYYYLSHDSQMHKVCTLPILQSSRQSIFQEFPIPVLHMYPCILQWNERLISYPDRDGLLELDLSNEVDRVVGTKSSLHNL